MKYISMINTTMAKSMQRSHILLLSLFGLILTGCQNIETEAKYPSGLERTTTGDDIYGDKQSVLGKEGIKVFSSNKSDNSAGNNGIDVNSFLWRASLDTVSFMPLASADPFGGVILTDWHMPAANTEERFKLNVFILGRELRSDGVRVRIFKQVKKTGVWVDIPADPATARQLEDTILTRARQLRVSQLANK